MNKRRTSSWMWFLYSFDETSERVYLSSVLICCCCISFSLSPLFILLRCKSETGHLFRNFERKLYRLIVSQYSFFFLIVALFKKFQRGEKILKWRKNDQNPGWTSFFFHGVKWSQLCCICFVVYPSPPSIAINYDYSFFFSITIIISLLVQKR